MGRDNEFRSQVQVTVVSHIQHKAVFGMITIFLFQSISHITRQKLICKSNQNEKALRETQTLRAGCSRAEPKISPRRRPPSRGRGTAEI